MNPAIAEVEATLLKSARLPGVESGASNLNIDLLLKVRGLGADGRALLQKMLGSADRKQKILAAQVLGKINDPQAVPALVNAASDEDAYVAAVAANGLAFMDGPPVADALRALAERPKNKLIEMNALFGLCRMEVPEGAKRALAYLENQSTTPQEKVVLVCNLALLGTTQLKPVVDRALEMFPNHPALRAVAIEFYKAEASPDSQSRQAALEAQARTASDVSNVASEVASRPVRG